MAAEKLLWSVVESIGDRRCRGVRFRWRVRGHHFVSADDTCGICPREILNRGIGEASVHVACSCSVTDEISDATKEGACGHIYVAHDVEGQAIVSKDEAKEAEIDYEFEEVCDEIYARNPNRLALPGLVRKVIEVVDEVFHSGGAQCGREDHELACEHDHDAHALFVHDEHLYREGDQEDVQAEKCPEDGYHPSVEKARQAGGLLHEFDAIGAQPVEHLEEEKSAKENDEAGVELISEDGHGKKSFSDGIPAALVKMLDFDWPQGAEEDGLACLAH